MQAGLRPWPGMLCPVQGPSCIDGPAPSPFTCDSVPLTKEANCCSLLLALGLAVWLQLAGHEPTEWPRASKALGLVFHTGPLS